MLRRAGSEIVAGKRKAVDALFRVFAFRGDPDGVFMFIFFHRPTRPPSHPGDHAQRVILVPIIKVAYQSYFNKARGQSGCRCLRPGMPSKKSLAIRDTQLRHAGLAAIPAESITELRSDAVDHFNRICRLLTASDYQHILAGRDAPVAGHAVAFRTPDRFETRFHTQPPV